MLLASDYNEVYYRDEYPLHRWYRTYDDWQESTGEYYRDRAKKLFDTYNLAGKKVLDIGCGFGYTVLDLRDMGADAYGIDFSEYAVGVANSPYVTQEDARTYAKGLKVNEYDLIIMCEFLCCLTDEEITQFVKDVGKKSTNFFVLEKMDYENEDYNDHTLEEWLTAFPEIDLVWRGNEGEWQQ